MKRILAEYSYELLTILWLLFMAILAWMNYYAFSGY